MDAALMIAGVIGNVLGMLGLVLAVLQIATAQDAAAEAAAAYNLDPSDPDPVHKIYAAGNGFVGPVAMMTIGMSMGSSFVEISGERMVCRLQRLCFVAICQQDASCQDLGMRPARLFGRTALPGCPARVCAAWRLIRSCNCVCVYICVCVAEFSLHPTQTLTRTRSAS